MIALTFPSRITIRFLACEESLSDHVLEREGDIEREIGRDWIGVVGVVIISG